MINPISSATQTPAVAHPATVPPKAPESKPQAAVTDTVTITRGVKAALQEVVETPPQTSIEASKGDLQAQRLLAKEAAAKAAYERNQR